MESVSIIGFLFKWNLEIFAIGFCIGSVIRLIK